MKIRAIFLVIGLMLALPAAGDDNLIYNGGFEKGLEGWYVTDGRPVVIAQAGPGEIESGVTVVYPPGSCSGPNVMIEVGTWKKELTPDGGPEVIWTRNPRHFVEPCGTSTEKEFTARYRIRVRCVDRETKTAVGDWIAGYSALGRPWPAECPNTMPAPSQVAPE